MKRDSIKLRLVVTLKAGSRTPRDARRDFVLAVRDAIARAALSGKIDRAAAEEFWRVLPDPEAV